MIKIPDKLIGKVIHYYDKIGVAVVKLNGTLKVGDKIKLVRGENEFTQEVTSMQIEHENIESAKKGDEVGLKVDQATKDSAEVYQVS